MRCEERMQSKRAYQVSGRRGGVQCLHDKEVDTYRAARGRWPETNSCLCVPILSKQLTQRHMSLPFPPAHASPKPLERPTTRKLSTSDR
jgi:hypothetical protein